MEATETHLLPPDERAGGRYTNGLHQVPDDVQHRAPQVDVLAGAAAAAAAVVVAAVVVAAVAVTVTVVAIAAVAVARQQARLLVVAVPIAVRMPVCCACTCDQATARYNDCPLYDVGMCPSAYDACWAQGDKLVHRHWLTTMLHSAAFLPITSHSPHSLPK